MSTSLLSLGLLLWSWFRHISREQESKSWSTSCTKIRFRAYPHNIPHLRLLYSYNPPNKHLRHLYPATAHLSPRCWLHDHDCNRSLIYEKGGSKVDFNRWLQGPYLRNRPHLHPLYPYIPPNKHFHRSHRTRHVLSESLAWRCSCHPSTNIFLREGLSWTCTPTHTLTKKSLPSQ